MMQIIARTKTPEVLIEEIEKAITEGDLKTWAKKKTTENGFVFYHNTPNGQWEEVIILPMANTKDEKVTFSVTSWKGKPDPEFEKQGYVLGRFVEILVVHFKNSFTTLIINK